MNAWFIIISFRLGDVGEMLTPMPPILNQHRIVTKFDELMALYDQLESNIRDKNDTTPRYTEAIVQQISVT